MLTASSGWVSNPAESLGYLINPTASCVMKILLIIIIITVDVTARLHRNTNLCICCLYTEMMYRDPATHTRYVLWVS